MKRIVAGLIWLVVCCSVVFGQQPWRHEWGVEFYSPAPPRLDGQKILANVGATAGANNYYYWVVVTYPVGSMSPAGPREVLGITAPAVGNTVTLSWPAQGGATSYTVVRTTTPAFPAACAACASAALAVTTLVDNGAVLPNAFAASGINPVSEQVLLSNRDFVNPLITLPSEVGMLGPNFGTVDWSAKTGDVRVYNARISSNFQTMTSLRGTDIRVTSTGGNLSPAGALVGGQFVSFVNPGTGSIGEVYGINAVVLHQAGASVNAFGAVGNIQFSGVNTGGSLYNVGVYGQIDDSTVAGISIPGTNFVSAMMGVVDNAGAVTRSIDAAFMAVLTAGTPTAAFMVVERNANPGRYFEFGLDMYGTTGFNAFNTADIRGQNQDMITNAAAGQWYFSRGSGNFLGVRLQPTEFNNLGAPADGTQAYCSNCDPGGGAIIACASAGAQTGAWAFRINGNWDCLSR